MGLELRSRIGPALVAVTALALAPTTGCHGEREEAPARPAGPTDARPPPAAAKVDMPQLLRSLAEAQDPRSFLYANDRRAELMAAAIPTVSDPSERLNLELTYAQELLNAGKTEAALAALAQVEQEAHSAGRTPTPELAAKVLMQEATAQLRLGEQQNCCANNNADSCLLPISGQGIHRTQTPSRNAIGILTRLLQHDPADLKARWLLNIAYMTLGEYPKGVAGRWRIDPKVYGAEYPMKKFYNAAPDSGLAQENRAGGAAMEDFDGDGNLDLMISSMSPDGQLRLYHNNGDGAFPDRTAEAGLLGETGGLNLTTTDFDNDGRPDVLVLRGGWFGKAGHLPVSLLHNDGGGRFTDVTVKSGLIKHMAPTQTAAWFDYNGDGALDLFIGNETTPDDVNRSELYRNNGDGTFSEVSHDCGLDITRYVKAVVSADYDHDRRPDLYLSCADGHNLLLHNDGPAAGESSSTAPWKFSEVGRQAGVDGQNRTFSSFFFDYDNDGWPDLYVGGYGSIDVGAIAADYLGMPNAGERARIYRNQGDGTFADVTRQLHMYRVIQGMGVNFGDLDNDGWLDFYVGTGNPELTTLIPNRMFRNAAGGYFQEVTTTGDFGHLQKGHGVAFGDVSNNGQEDVFIELGGAYTGDTAHNALFVNPGNRNHWVTLKLEGVKSNRVAIGAETRVMVTTPHGDRSIHQTVGSGGSFGCNPFRQHFGLGDATGIKEITVHWPVSGIIQEVKNVTMDRFWTLREGAADAEPWAVKTFRLPHAPPKGTAGPKAILMR